MKYPGAYRPRKLGDDAVQVRELSRLRLRMLAAAACGMVVTLIAGGIWQFKVNAETQARLTQLEQDNSRLAEELGVSRLALEMERATSSGLERQLAELNDALTKRQAELEFLRQLTAPPLKVAPKRPRAPTKAVPQRR